MTAILGKVKTYFYGEQKQETFRDKLVKHAKTGGKILLTGLAARQLGVIPAIYTGLALAGGKEAIPALVAHRYFGLKQGLYTYVGTKLGGREALPALTVYSAFGAGPAIVAYGALKAVPYVKPVYNAVSKVAEKVKQIGQWFGNFGHPKKA